MIKLFVPFPTMKSQGAAKNEANNAAQGETKVSASDVKENCDQVATKLVEEIDFSNVEVEPLFEDMVDFDTFAQGETKVSASDVKENCDQVATKLVEEIDFSNVEVEPLFEDMVDFDTFSKSDFRAVKVKECEAVPKSKKLLKFVLNDGSGEDRVILSGIHDYYEPEELVGKTLLAITNLPVPKSKKLLKFVLNDGSGEDRVILSGIHDYYEPEELVGKTLLAITNLPPRKMMGIDSCGMIISATHLVEGREGLNVLILDDKIPAGAKLY